MDSPKPDAPSMQPRDGSAPPSEEDLSEDAPGLRAFLDSDDDDDHAAVLLPPPADDSRRARLAVGYDPIAVSVAGWPWSPLERRAFGAEHSYGAVRARIETEYVRLLHPVPGIARLITHAAGGPPELVRLRGAAELRLALSNVGFLLRRAPDKDLVRVPIADAWLRDPNARALHSIVFDPSKPPGVSANVWNNWPGLAAAHLDAAAYDPHALLLIRSHLQDVLCSGVAAHAEWLLDYLASIVQRPWAKTGVAVLFTGAQGAGKNTVLDFFRERVLGPRVAVQLQQPSQGLFDHFGSMHAGKILIQIDEADRLGGVENALKHLITGDTATVHRKYTDREVVTNYANLILTTNGQCPVHIPAHERRFCIFHVSSHRLGDTAYFDALHAALARPAVARAFYDLLMARPLPADLSAGRLQNERPITGYYLACRMRGLDPLRRFLSACVNRNAYDEHCLPRDAAARERQLAAAIAARRKPPVDRRPEVRTQHFYADYLAFFHATGAARNESGLPVAPLSLVSFIGALGILCPASRTVGGPDLPADALSRGLTRIRTAAGINCVLDYAALRINLERSREFDPDALFMQPPHPSAIAYADQRNDAKRRRVMT